MDALLIAALVVSPCLATTALLMTARQTRHNLPLPVDPRRLALAQGAVVAGVVFWMKLSQAPGLHAEWGAGVALLLGLIGIAAVQDPLRAGRALWATAVVFPVGAVVAVSSRYIAADGIVSGAGGTEPFSEMAVVAVMSSIGFFSGPAFTVGSMLGMGDRSLDHDSMTTMHLVG